MFRIKVKFVDDIKGSIFVITLIYSLLFFAILAILGKEYTGKEGDSSFVLLNLVFVGLSFGFIFGEHLYKKTASLRRINLLFYLLPIFTSLIYLIESPSHEYAYRYFTVYLGLSFPAMYIGTYVAANNSLKSMAKWWDIVPVILSLGLIASFTQIIFARDRTEVMLGGGLEYQGISYLAAFAYSLGLFSIIFGDRYPRFKFCKSKIFVAITYCLMFFQVITVFVTGGRGGFVVIFLSSVLLLFLKFKENIKFKRIIFATIIISISYLLLSTFLPQEVTSLMKQGNLRIFSYISSGGIDMSETSGRDIYYTRAINLIKDQPILGYGIFKYVDRSGDYPHNIFLEFLLQGGLFYFLFWLILLVRLGLKSWRLFKKADVNLLLVPIAVSPFSELLFSGSYLMSPLFWFVIAYVFSLNKRDIDFNLAQNRINIL